MRQEEQVAKVRHWRRKRDVNADEPVLTVLLDPGHGGTDPGAMWQEDGSGVGKIVMEKDINLAVAAAIAAAIPPEVDVRMSRAADDFIALRERVLVPYTYDLFLSIHCNAIDPKHYDRAEVSGVEVHVFDAKDPVLHGLAQRFLDVTAKGLGIEPNTPNPIRSSPKLRVLSLSEQVRDRYGRSPSLLRPGPVVDPNGPWRGLKGKGVPALILELGYLTNDKDRRVLVSKKAQAKCARAIGALIGELAGASGAVTEVVEDSGLQLPEDFV
jgi:N-acetylmuramoyl-L-alanine amidase